MILLKTELDFDLDHQSDYIGSDNVFSNRLICVPSSLFQLRIVEVDLRDCQTMDLKGRCLNSVGRLSPSSRFVSQTAALRHTV